MKIFGFVLLAWPIGMVFSGCSKQGEDQAKARFQDYMAAWQERNFHRMWEVMSPSVKIQNFSESESQFTNYIKAHNLSLASYTIQKIEIEGNTASIIVDMTARELSSNRMLGTERQACMLSLHQGLWYFDSCKLAH
jgi:hypothetical protein